MQLRQSPLASWHHHNLGRMVNFGGWELPVQYSSIIAEHRAVRQSAGIFDISHMTQAYVEGSSASEWLQEMMTNDIAKATEGKGVYTAMCNDHGGVIDDLYVFGLGSSKYFLVMNASREEVDIAWLNAHLKKSVTVSCIDDRGGLALQGPKSAGIMGRISPDALELKRNEMLQMDIVGHSALISRTGYTGEDGFEVFTSADGILPIWEALWDVGHSDKLTAAGLGARDTLRLEMGYPLYGHELNEDISPFEIGYNWVVKLNKTAEFIGKGALLRELKAGSRRKLVGLILTQRGVPRERFPVMSDGVMVGMTTSGTHSPSLGKGICLALVEAEAKEPYSVEVGGKLTSAVEVKLPFYNGKC